MPGNTAWSVPVVGFLMSSTIACDYSPCLTHSNTYKSLMFTQNLVTKSCDFPNEFAEADRSCALPAVTAQSECMNE